MDNLDRQIITFLQEDGRTSNTVLCKRLGVSEATVRKRIARLLASKAIQITAVADPHALGFTIWVQIGIVADLHRLEAIAKELADLPEVFFLCLTTGEYDLLLAAVFKSIDDLREFLTERLGLIEGVRRTFTSHILRIVKRTFAYRSDPLSSIGHDEQLAVKGKTTHLSGPPASRKSKRRVQ